ncbi:hypothetical protein ABZ234_03460 [Nocardiopsis sp. NPDC006198]|uniref:hypothetical protein n=1 Tax=Nocardiopsis sp. NPDC006198 TaxID=3154472 RepID=UPI0033BB0C70
MTLSDILQEPNWWAVGIAALAFLISLGSLYYAHSSASASHAAASEAKRANDLVEQQLNEHKHPWEVTERAAEQMKVRNSDKPPVYKVVIYAPNGKEYSWEEVGGWQTIVLDTSMSITQVEQPLWITYQMDPSIDAERHEWTQ